MPSKIKTQIQQQVPFPKSQDKQKNPKLYKAEQQGYARKPPGLTKYTCFDKCFNRLDPFRKALWKERTAETPLGAILYLRHPTWKQLQLSANNPLVLEQISYYAYKKSSYQGIREKSSQTTEINQPILATFDFFLILDLQQPEHVDLLAPGFCSCHLQTSDILQIMPGPNLPLQSVGAHTNMNKYLLTWTNIDSSLKLAVITLSFWLAEFTGMTATFLSLKVTTNDSHL